MAFQLVAVEGCHSYFFLTFLGSHLIPFLMELIT